MKYIVIAGVLIIIAFIVALQFIPLGIEPLTEVYFENHTILPKYLFPDKAYNYTFTVHNLEYQKMNYTYNITAYTADDIYIMKQGDFVLEDNESKSFYEEFEFERDFEKARIQIDIQKQKIETPKYEKKLWWQDPNYPKHIDIHFWVEEIVPVKIITTNNSSS